MDEFFTRLYAKADTLFTTLTPVAFVLIVYSLWSNISGGNRSATMYLRALAQAIVVVAVLSQFSEWLKLGQQTVSSLVYDTLEANPATVFEKYKAMSATASDDSESGGFWHTIFSEGQIFRGVVAAVLWHVQLFAKIVVFIAAIIHKVAMAFAIAASPIFIGFLCVRALSGIGVKFLLGTIGILLWPLGWAFASLVTDALLEIMADGSFVEASGMEAFKNLIGVAVAGIWMIFSTIAAPLIIQRMISEGTNAGIAFLEGGARAAKAGVQSGATAGAAAAGALAFGSASMSGSAGSSIGGLTATAAGWGKSTFGSSSKPSFDSSDPANDRKAAAAIRKSRNRS